MRYVVLFFAAAVAVIVLEHSIEGASAVTGELVDGLFRALAWVAAKIHSVLG